MSILEAIVLGLVQGLTEFIPISSTAHLTIVPTLLGWGDPGAAASAVIQFGTLLAAILYFAGDLVKLTRGFFRGLVTRKVLEDPDSRMAWMVIIGTVPIVILGLLLKDQIETTFRGMLVITTMVIVIAVLMQIAERWTRGRDLRNFNELTVRDAVSIGLGQCLALVPGSSRSGSTIMTSLFLGIDRAAAARFSFLLSIPAIAGAGVFELVKEWDHLAAVGWLPLTVSAVVAFLSGYASIWFLLRYLRSHTTHVFIYYRYALGAVMIALLVSGVVK